MAIATACATGTNAIGEAAAIIRRGDADVMLAGGSEAAILRLSMAGFDVMGAMSTRNESPKRPAGRLTHFVMALSSPRVQEFWCSSVWIMLAARGANIYGEVAGYGCTADAFHITAPA